MVLSGDTSVKYEGKRIRSLKKSRKLTEVRIIKRKNKTEMSISAKESLYAYH